MANCEKEKSDGSKKRAPRKKVKWIDLPVPIIEATTTLPDSSHQMVRRSQVYKEKPEVGVKRPNSNDTKGPQEKRRKKAVSKKESVPVKKSRKANTKAKRASEEKTPKNMIEIQSEAQSEIPKKRGRGRPRKNQNVDTPTPVTKRNLERATKAVMLQRLEKIQEATEKVSQKKQKKSEKKMKIQIPKAIPTAAAEVDTKVVIPKIRKKRGRTKRSRMAPRQMKAVLAVVKNKPVESIIREATPSVGAAKRVSQHYSRQRTNSSQRRRESQITETSTATSVPVETLIPARTADRIAPSGIPITCKSSDFWDITHVQRGAFGNVKSATCLATNEKVALKYFNHDKMADLGISNTSLKREFDVHIQAMGDENVARLIGCFMFSNSHVFVMEFFERGDLHDLIHAKDLRKPHNIFRVKLYIRQILSALCYLQSHVGYIHKDVKPENILVASENYVKLTDFGCCIKMQDYRHVHNYAHIGGTPGTFPYYAMEEISLYEFDSTTDVWAVACITFEMFLHHLPFVVYPDRERQGQDEELWLRRMRRMETGDYQCPEFDQLRISTPLAWEFIRSVSFNIGLC